MAIGSSLIQTPAQVSRISNFFVVGDGVALSCTSSSSTVTLPALPDGSSATDIMAINIGSVAGFIAFDETAPTVVIPTATPANGICIPPGAVMIFNKSASDGFAGGITASGTATIYLYQGYGS